MHKYYDSAAYIAGTIRAFLDGSGGEWDWDDFTSCPMRDAQLESIRRRAAAVPLPGDAEGLAVLTMLAEEAEELASR